MSRAPRPGGETGRHSGLKIRRHPEKERAGSIPARGTSAVLGAMLAALEHIPYVTPSGREPVTDFLVSLSPDDMEAALADIEDVCTGWPVGFPLVRKRSKAARSER